MLDAARCSITDRTNEWRWLARRPLIRSTLVLRIVALETRSASGARVDGESSTDESSPESSMSSDEASDVEVDDGTAGPSPVQEDEGSAASSLSEDSIDENDSGPAGTGTPQSDVRGASRPASAQITGRVTFQVAGAGTVSLTPSGASGDLSRRRNKGAEAGLSAAQKLAAADQDWASRQTVLSVRSSTLSRGGGKGAEGGLLEGEAVYAERLPEQRGQLDSITAELLQGALSSWGYSDVVPNAAAQLGSGFFCGGHVLLVGADAQVG